MERATINISGVIGGKELGIEGAKSFGYTDLLVQLAKTPDAKAFDFVIDTDGGSVAEGFRIAEVIESLENTRTIAKKVYSIGNVIYFAGQERVISGEAETETFMLHQAVMPGDKVGEMMLNPDQLRALATDLEDTTSYIAAYIASRSGIGVTKLVALMGVDRYINAADAVALGFLGSRKNSSVNIQNMANKVEAAFSNLIAKARKLLGSAANMAVTLKDGAGEIWIETEDGIVVGKKAYSTEGGEALADGMYEIEDGRTLEIKGGVVESETEDAGDFPTPEAEDKGKQLAEALDKIAALEAELMKSKSEMDVVAEERNLANEQLKAANIVLNNVGRVTSKPLPKIEGSANLGGYTEKKPMALTTAQQLEAVQKIRNAYSKQ